MTTRVVVFPFDQFGAAGTGAGALLLADAVREMIADCQEESRPVRGDAYADHVAVDEASFETPADLVKWQQSGAKLAKRRAGEFLIWLGGNHLSVLPALTSLNKRDLIIQFDAHLDLYDLSDSTTELSHGNYLKLAKSKLPPVVHVGHRDLFLPESQVTAAFRSVFPSEQVDAQFATMCRKLRLAAADAAGVWIDIDCDVLDPAFFPAVRQPQPFGLTPMQLLQLIDAVWSERTLGFSISEFDPACDRRDQSLAILIWLIERLLLRRHEPASAERDEEE